MGVLNLGKSAKIDKFIINGILYFAFKIRIFMTNYEQIKYKRGEHNGSNT